MLAASEKKRLELFIERRQTRAECETYVNENKAAVFKILGKLPGCNFTQAQAMIYRADAISYEYPATIIKLEQDLAAHKKVMQLDGRAKRIVKGCVKFENLR